MAKIRLIYVQKVYGDRSPVIARVSPAIARHDVRVFPSGSGCGKSTLLQMFAGLEDSTPNELQIGGRLVNDIPTAGRSVARVFQRTSRFPHIAA
ncbi:ATP-binding cassette domain-containing protein [Paraburkholderia adhaesiva]|uniref:ATP-binding cassette domain-containing protein n=1 Tax=Paraburkholderia adhaesiva TaxID=2883244 RepID=UPI001F436127|nr:ATP-binding cassette domain-containing protein [Paraburkholderia adhaesiva]